jgi:hypothetical protein
VNFKVGAVYKLPNGRELIARENGSDKIVLNNRNSSEADRYELKNQRLLLNGKLTGWGVSDLVDTGRTETSEHPA